MLRIFRLKPEERWLALAALLVVLTLNGLVIAQYYDQLTPFADDYHSLARDVFHISGFDAWSYSIVSRWNGPEYNIYRHPLLAVFMYVPYLINQLLIAITGINCAIFVVGAIEVFCGFYAIIFFYRVLHEVMELRATDAYLLTALFFSFGYMMLTVMVPDHFNLTLCMMMITLYIAGRRLKNRHLMKIWQTVLLFFFTAGVSLNNGIKIFLAVLFTNGRKMFRPRFMLLAVLLPSALIWGIAVAEFQTWAAPMEKVAKERQKAKEQQLRDSLFQVCADSLHSQDTALIRRCVKQRVQRMAVEKYRRNHANPKIGDPMSKKGFMAWTDATTDRWDSMVENLFGESIQLHRACLLQDILKDNRPMIIPYELDYYYWIEALIAALFVAGIWCGRRSKFFWLVFSWFVFDMLIHVVLGFGINEVYIMTAQWAFVIPIAIACLFHRLSSWLLWVLRAIVLTLMLYLATYNGTLIVNYLT